MTTTFVVLVAFSLSGSGLFGGSQLVISSTYRFATLEDCQIARDIFQKHAAPSLKYECIPGILPKGEGK